MIIIILAELPFNCSLIFPKVHSEIYSKRSEPEGETHSPLSAHPKKLTPTPTPTHSFQWCYFTFFTQISQDIKTPKKNDSLETTLDEGRGGGSVGWRRFMMYGTGLKIRVLTLRCLNNSFVCDWLKCTTQRSSAWLRKHSTGKSAGRSGNLRGWTKSFLVFFVFRSWPLRNMFL